MKKLPVILFWLSGLSLGLMVCAYFACPLWKVAVPIMLLLGVLAGSAGFNKLKTQKSES